MAGRFVFRTLSSMSRSRSLHGAHAPAAVRASTPASHSTSVARHFNTFPCSRPAAKTGRTTLEKVDVKDDDKFWRRIMGLCGFACVSCTFGQFLDECASSCNNRSGSHLCPTCSNAKRSV